MQNDAIDNVVVDFGSTKQAALFFDHVVPLDGVEDVSGVATVLTGAKTPVDVQKAQSIISQLLPPEFGTAQQVEDFASVAAIGVSAISAAVGFFNCDEMTQTAKEYEAKLDAPGGLKKYVGKTPVTVNANMIDDQAKHDLRRDFALLSIADIQIPDPKQLSWDAIIEFRKDVLARKRLRRLRVFAVKEYTGKSLAFIEDDLSIRLDDYEQTLKSWSIKTVVGVLSTCVNLETTLSAGVANLVAIMSGMPASQAFAASLAIPCSRFALELAKVRIDRQEAIRQFPLAYIADVKRLASDSRVGKER
ncbi:MAG: hypothetical protein ACR2FY_05470 [Pirellulaceae bacterium]